LSDLRPEEQPDFEALYGNRRLTSRMAARLWTVALYVSDAFRQGPHDRQHDRRVRKSKDLLNDRA
jgi:hypothetical protein